METKLDRRSLLGAGLALGLSASGSPAQESPKRGDQGDRLRLTGGLT